MTLPIQNLHKIDESGPYIVETNVDVPLRTASKSLPDDPRLVRVNVYRPKTDTKLPVLVTYGPYGKDIPYRTFHPKSFAEVNPEHRSEHSGWETPDPAYWTAQGYVVVRADERGCGQSPGKLDTMSPATSDCFYDVIEWAADQSWSNGKVGLLGISYFAGSQWRVAARRPKGLAAMIPWEAWWWDRQVVSNQYGLPGRAARNWGPDTLEGNLTEEELLANRADQTLDTSTYRFLDDEYYAVRDFQPEDIEVPLLSVANWGGILLHLRGNITGFLRAGSKFKYLRCITGRHDLPFYYKEEVEIQKSFLDAFLKGQDDRGWSVPGKLPPVDICLRKGNPGVNDPPAELATFPRRLEKQWPLEGTKYTDFHLSSSGSMSTIRDSTSGKLSYSAPKGEISFRSTPFKRQTEVTGHPLARLSFSLSSVDESAPSELDVFLTIRHFDAEHREVSYTGTTGEPVPVVKGWLRLSLRKTCEESPLHKDYMPYREYKSVDVQPVHLDHVYSVDVEIWPTNVVVEAGSTLELQVSSCDTAGSGLFNHTHPQDRKEENLKGLNNIHIGPDYENFLRLPIIER
ncbi:alpha/beta-hydrolase [Aureobasidium sp. EXF-8845]|nr:alpha/beta-hydrolase [Aureobasidium sp. EXF-8845]KAI4858038.1 alpha/beta-hydrolase [Aureobasidium sp. EXF-8846]